MTKPAQIISAGAPITRQQALRGKHEDAPLTGYKVTLERLVLTNPMGLDLRCAALLARTALQYEASIEVEHSGRVADGKNLTDLVALDIPCAGVVTISAYGQTAQPALEAIHTLFYSAFQAEEAAPEPLNQGMTP